MSNTYRFVYFAILLSVIMLCFSCVSSKVTESDELVVDENAVFYILTEGDHLGVCRSIADFLEHAGLKNNFVEKMDDIPPSSTPITSGTGFNVSPDIVITNAHVVGNESSVRLIRNGKEENATVLYKNDSNDIAILKSENEISSYFEIVPTSSISIADRIYTIGYPLPDILGSEIKVTGGIINSFSGLSGDSNYIQISTQIQPGNSGGPVMNDNFQVVGVASSKLSDSYVVATRNVIAQDVNFAINSDIVSMYCSDYLIGTDSSRYVKTMQEAMNATVMVLSGGNTISMEKKYCIAFGYNAYWDVFHYTASYMSMACIDMDSREIVSSFEKNYFTISNIFEIAKGHVRRLLYKEQE